MKLTDSILDLIVQSLIEVAWNRPELTRLREPIEATLKGSQFKSLTQKAFQEFAENAGDDLPEFFDEGFIQMPAVQGHLADYVIRGQDADIEGLAEEYAKRHLKPSDAPQVRDKLEGYLRQLRETFATDATYGPILLAGLPNDDTTPVLTWLRDANPELAAWCVLESGAHTPDETLEMLRDVWIPRLTDLGNYPQPEARAAVGRGLGLLKLDDRPGVGLHDDCLPDIVWCKIPPGTYKIGGDPDAYKAFKARTYTVKREYWLAKYPVTYMQFQAFLDDPDGFNRDDWWQDLTEEYRKQPMAEQEFKFANHPRENVSWYQAVAFCRWLNARYHEHKLLPAGWEIRLPTEYEWEAAARYPDGRKFPWGDDYIAGYANINEPYQNTGPHYLERTSAVGMYPQGRNPANDLHDLGGNVFEWCLNEYRNPENMGVSGDALRVLRGGAWSDGLDDARAAYRYHNFPFYRNALLGFRVVVCPVL